MKKFEYKVVEMEARRYSGHLDRLNFLGQDGWELVAVMYVGNMSYFFKREILRLPNIETFGETRTISGRFPT